MYWLILLMFALAMGGLGLWLQPTDDVHTLAAFSAGLFSALWGFAIAPSTAQLLLTLLALGCWQFSFRRV